MEIRNDGIYTRRVWWWFPAHVTNWWLPRIWLGGDEWCNVPVCINIPPLGAFLIYWRPRWRTMPCDECWEMMDEVLRADFLPGGCYEGGRVHEDRAAALYQQHPEFYE